MHFWVNSSQRDPPPTAAHSSSVPSLSSSRCGSLPIGVVVGVKQTVAPVIFSASLYAWLRSQML